jgi:hypothetical protein
MARCPDVRGLPKVAVDAEGEVEDLGEVFQCQCLAVFSRDAKR